MRQEHHGALCGYVGVPRTHPLHRQPVETLEPDLEVHGGLTYSGACSGKICHTPEPGEPDDVWWFGFDCAHAFDIIPGMQFGTAGPRYEYRTLEYVTKEVNQLAEQLAALA